MGNRAAITLLLVLFAGCRHMQWEEPEVDPESAKLRRWLGYNVHGAISEFGPPTDVVPNGQSSIYEWRYTGPSRAVIFGGGWVSTGSAWTDSCREWFDVDQNEIIFGWHWKGRC